MNATDGSTASVWHEATAAARAAGVSVGFFLEDMNYKALVALFRGTLRSGCPGCGVAFRTEAEVYLTHLVPPRHAQDWARLHARNVSLLCGACAQAVTTQTYGAWLDSHAIPAPARPGRFWLDREED
jgi:hypothetical protein